MEVLTQGIADGIKLSGNFPNEFGVDYIKAIVSVENKESLLKFSELVSKLSKALHSLGTCEECVEQIADAGDVDYLCCELRGLLAELDFPTRFDATGLVEHIRQAEGRLTILDFLVSELLASKILASSQKRTQVVDSEYAILQNIVECLGISADISRTSVAQLFGKIDEKVKAILSQSPPNTLGKPLLTVTPTARQWEKIECIYQLLYEDYLARREMQLKRLDVTVRSFLWSQRTKDMESQVMSTYGKVRPSLTVVPDVRFSDLLAARDDLLTQQKTCATKAGSVNKLKKHKIGSVPDRGGRVEEYEPLETETFASQQMAKRNEGQRRGQRPMGRGAGGGRGYSNGRGDYRPQRPPYVETRPTPPGQYYLDDFQRHDQYGQAQAMHQPPYHQGYGNNYRVQGNWAMDPVNYGDMEPPQWSGQRRYRGRRY